MKFTNTQKAFGAIIIANVIWSAASVIFKISLTNIPPFTLAFLRFAIAPLLLLPFLGKKANLHLQKRSDVYALIAYAVSGITSNIVFYFLGLQRTYAVNATIIASGAPVVTLLLAHTFLHEKISLRKFAGFLLGAIGLLLIIFGPITSHEVDGSILGNFFLVLAILSAVIQLIIGRGILPRYNPTAFTFWSFIIGAASFLPLAGYEFFTKPGFFALLDWRAYMGIFYGAVFSSAIAYTFFAWGVSKISATDTSLITHLDPIIGTILAYFVLHEPITRPFVAATVLIFTGIYIAEGRLHYHPLHKLRYIADPVIPPEIGSAINHSVITKERKKVVIASLYQK